MRLRRRHRLTLAFLLGSLGAASAGPLDSLYEPGELASLQPRYLKGWLGNYDRVFRPALTTEEQARLERVTFHMPLVVADQEPLSFSAAGATITASAGSIRFLEDIALAWTWLDMNGYDTRTVGDYLLMLRHWTDRKGRAPAPLATLCVPDFSKAGERVEERARRAFNAIVVFALLHEVGHVLHRHPGNQAVAPDVSRANEEAADRFAVDMFKRIREVPLGVPLLFFTMAHLFEGRADFASEEAYQRALATRTHPLSPARLMSLARHVTAGASAFGQGFRPGAQASAMSVSLEISQLALLMDDPDVQRLSARIGQSVGPEDLAPRERGRHLARPCDAALGNHQPFHGTLRGQISNGKTPLDLDVVLTRRGDEVTGSYSFGAGFGRIRGSIAGDTLRYVWTMPADSGTGIMRLADGTYRGTWTSDRSPARGSMQLQGVP